jgi:hypothetical protein
MTMTDTIVKRADSHSIFYIDSVYLNSSNGLWTHLLVVSQKEDVAVDNRHGIHPRVASAGGGGADNTSAVRFPVPSLPSHPRPFFQLGEDAALVSLMPTIMLMNGGDAPQSGVRARPAPPPPPFLSQQTKDERMFVPTVGGGNAAGTMGRRDASAGSCRDGIDPTARIGCDTRSPVRGGGGRP